MDDIADHVAVVGHPDTDSVELKTEGDTAVVSREYTGFDDLTEFEGSRKHDVFATYIAAPDRSLLSLDYLRNVFTNPRKQDLKTGCTFRFGDELPIKNRTPARQRGVSPVSPSAAYPVRMISPAV